MGTLSQAGGGVRGRRTGGALSPTTAVLLYIQVNVGLAFVDVMIDGMVVDTVRGDTEASAMLFSLGSVAHFLCAGVGALVKGHVQSHFGCRGQFLCLAAFLYLDRLGFGGCRC